MPSSEEIRRSLAGVLMLARMDAGGMRLLDLSVDGFWKSFAAPALAAPAAAVLTIAHYVRTGTSGAVIGTAAVELLGYVLGCLAFPIAAIFLTRLLGLSARYVPLVVAANWAAVPQVVLLLSAVVIAAAVPPLGSSLLPFAALAIVAYSWFVVRTALQTTWSVAFGIVVVDLLISFSVDRVMEGLLPLSGAQP